MYTLYSDAAGRSLHGDTLEELREQLVNFHLYNRVDAQFDDFLDQAYAVHPLDESEKDYGETVPTPRPLTEDLLLQLAQHVWDTPHVKLEETTDINRLADTLHYMFDMDTSAARDILRDYISQLEQADNSTIDEDEISRDDADFLIESVKSARVSGDIAGNKLAEVEEAAADYRGMQEEADTLRELRDKAITTAVAAGASKADVARAAGISKQSVAKVVQRRRG